jgi:hypothetical protein
MCTIVKMYDTGPLHSQLLQSARDMLQLVQEVLRCGNPSLTASEAISTRCYFLPEGML